MDEKPFIREHTFPLSIHSHTIIQLNKSPYRPSDHVNRFGGIRDETENRIGFQDTMNFTSEIRDENTMAGSVFVGEMAH